MANYYGSARSNYFKVKSETAFLVAISLVPDVEVHTGKDGTVCLLVDSGDTGCWPTMSYNDETGEELEIDVPQIVSEHLVDGEVAVFMEGGAEKLRYIIGYAEAINSKGERESISLDGIYELAAGLSDRPEDITRAEY